MSRRVLGGRPLWGSSRPPSHPMGGTGAPGAGHAVTHTLLLSLPAKKYKKVTGKEIYSDTLESTAMLEKAKFPQDYFPEVRPRRAAGLFRERSCPSKVFGLHSSRERSHPACLCAPVLSFWEAGTRVGCPR